MTQTAIKMTEILETDLDSVEDYLNQLKNTEEITKDKYGETTNFNLPESVGKQTLSEYKSVLSEEYRVTAIDNTGLGKGYVISLEERS